eukprot:Opistho-2@51291
MANIEWKMWANMQACFLSFILFISGIIATRMSNAKDYGIYALIICFFIFALEWPRSKRTRGTACDRPYQKYLQPFPAHMGVVGRNLYIRGAFYLCVAAPCFIKMPLQHAGILSVITSVVYFRAAFAGEEWIAEAKRETRGGGGGGAAKAAEPAPSGVPKSIPSRSAAAAGGVASSPSSPSMGRPSEVALEDVDMRQSTTTLINRPSPAANRPAPVPRPRPPYTNA